MTDKLITLRNQIDKIDPQIIKLIAKRIEIVKQIGDYKKLNNLKAFDSKRWQDLLKSKQEIAKKYNISTQLITEIFTLLHRESLTIENDFTTSLI